MPRGHRKLMEFQVIEALDKAHGLKTLAAENLNVAFVTLDKFISENAKCQECLLKWRTGRKDKAEFKLDEAVEKGEPWAIAFTLRNARERGYGERVDVTTNGEAIGTLTDEELVKRLTAIMRNRRRLAAPALPEPNDD